MFYTGKDKKIEWRGPVSVHSGQLFLVDGIIAVPVGKAVPENWVGKTVKVTVELVEEVS